MPEPIRLIRLGPVPYRDTQSVYHALAEAMGSDSPDTIILCRPASPYLSLGYHQALNQVLDRAECIRRGLPVLRRQVGGGATYLDSNQLFYQCVFRPGCVPPFAAGVFAHLLAGPVATLRRLGLNGALHGTNEIEVGGRRIAGTGGGQIGEARVVVGNLLFDFDYETLPRLWRVPSESFRALAREALHANVTTLRAELESVEMETVERVLMEEFARTLGRSLEPDSLTPAEIEDARQVGARLESEEFLNLHSDARPRPLKISARVSIHAEEFETDGFRVHANLLVRDGVIESARLESDPARDWQELEARLRGVPYDEWRLSKG